MLLSFMVWKPINYFPNSPIVVIICIDGMCPDPGYPPGGYSYTASLEEDGMIYYICQKTGYRPKDIYPILCTEVNGQLQWNSSDVKFTHECVGQLLMWGHTKITCCSTTIVNMYNCIQVNLLKSF